MEKLFLKIINMSIISSYVILFVILIRLLLKKAPKIYSYVLWLVAFFRLIFPFSFKSIFSLMPINTNTIPKDIIYSQTPEIQSGITVIDGIVNNRLPVPIVGGSVNPMQIWISLGQWIWILGIIVLIVYSIVSTIKLSKKLKSSKLLRANIYENSSIDIPFVFGIVKPKIYIPFGLSEAEKSYIIKHEECHIRRFDHRIKFFGFIIVSIHWFNPLVWLAFFLMSKDMELSCDESVIREMGNSIKKDYSKSLLSLSTGRKIIIGSPLAFGGKNTKSRIKNILNYRKPKFWMSLIGIIIVVVVSIGLLSNPKNPATIEDFMDIAIEIGDSSKFTKDEINSAIQLVIKDFDFPASTLTKIWYDDEESDKFTKSYIEGGGGSVNGAKAENTIVLLTNFDVDDSGDNPVLNPGSTYEDYHWILIRDDKTSQWEIEDWGY